MALRGRIGGLTTAARHDSRELTQPARAKFLERFEREVDPERMLPEAERLRRAECARRAYFAKLAYQSARARGAKARKKIAAVDQTAATREVTRGDDTRLPH